MKSTEPTAAWMFPEFEPVGVDLGSRTSVEDYDRNQGTSAVDDDALPDRLGVARGTVFVDIGTGTGSLPVRAAVRGASAMAVDVSTEMLEFTRRRAADSDVELALHHAGFLTYEHEGRPADVVTTRFSLHQLPDTWKQVALNRLARTLRPGGLLYLRDVMWSFAPEETVQQLPAWIEATARPEGRGFTRADFETHVRDEFSTFSWILEGMVERAGLTLEATSFPAPWYGEILACR